MKNLRILLVFALLGSFTSLHAQQNQDELKRRIQSLPPSTHPDTIIRLKNRYIEKLVSVQGYQEILEMYEGMDSLIAANPDKLQHETLYRFKFIKASISLNTGNFPLAQKQLAALKPLANSPYYEVPLYKSYGTYYLWKGEHPDSALYFFRKAIALYARDSLPRNLAVAVGDALGNIGLLYFDQARYDSAIYYLEDAAKLFTQHGFKQSALNSKLNLGSILASAKRYEVATTYFKEVYEDTEEVGYEADIKYYALTNWLRTVLDRGVKDDSLMQLVVETFPKTNQPQFMRSRFEMAHALAEYEKLQENHVKALEFTQEALAAGKAVASPGEILQALALAGDIQIRLNEPQKALIHLEKALELEQYGNPIELRALYNNLRKAYGALDDAKNTVAFTDKYLAVVDSINKQQVTEQLAEQEVRFKTEKKEQENSLLKAQNKAKEAEIEIKNTQNILLFGSVLGLIIIVGLIFQAQRRQKKTNALLRQKNDEIKEQHEQKALLLREIHHRVKNNLKVVSSLLDLQVNRLDSDFAIEAVNEGKARVNTIALIHEKLYGTEDISQIDFEEYAGELLEQVAQVFEGRVKVERSILAPSVTLDIDTAVPLGLIVNELISNAYKHAFKESDSGKIAIRLAQKEGDFYELLVADNGAGWPENFNPKFVRSLGLQLIKGLSKQLKGEMELFNDNGAVFKLSFKAPTLT